MAQAPYGEIYRPQVHFSPKEHWINDPNGMVFYKGIYHMFFQYYPDGIVWGPMHWGHATSKDLVHWQQQPTALYPDSLGYIFSGSAVLDKDNTSGFGKNGRPPLVAIYTNHDPVREKEKRNDFQNQSIAYSIDDGNTWTKYAANPVLKNPGITDFRDPKVMWYAPSKKWIMTLATKDRITFYSSPDLKQWKKESEFGKELGAHGGVWECPDLFPLDDNGKKVWALIVNINPGAPNGGSGTQYFLGDFDGKVFTPNNTKTKWLDYGPDDYAGITWSNTGDRKIMIGWMSNWQYAALVPTSTWRNAMTIPRELKLKHVGNEMFIASEPVHELKSLQTGPTINKKITLSRNMEIDKNVHGRLLPSRLDLTIDTVADVSIVYSNDLGENIELGYDKASNRYFIDRTKAGNTSFEKGFAARHTAPRLGISGNIDLTIVADESSVELFADGGLSVMTEIFFPSKPFNRLSIKAPATLLIDKMEYCKLKGIW